MCGLLVGRRTVFWGWRTDDTRLC